MTFKPVIFLICVIHFCNCKPNGYQPSDIVLDEELKTPIPPPGLGDLDGRSSASGSVNYNNLKYKISWGHELKGKGSGTYLQLPANRLPSKFKPNYKYYLAFGSPDWSYGGCSNGVPCRFLEHCKPTARFFDSFSTFAANSCLIGDDFIGVCCPIGTSIPRIPVTTTRRPKSLTLPSSYRCGDLVRFDRRVVGGEPADKDDWPWMAAIFDSEDNEQFCGGVLISNRHVLTAAHCLRNVASPSEVFVRLGEYDLAFRDFREKDFKVNRIKLHEEYDRFTQMNDIALLTLSTTVAFSKSIRHICLPKKDMVLEGNNAHITGWGTLCLKCDGSNRLMELYLPIWKQSECVATYAKFRLPIQTTQLCAGFKSGGKDSCRGDSGGPLMTKNDNGRWAVVGIVSYGKGCAQANAPGVYTRVSSYINWIQSNARD